MPMRSIHLRLVCALVWSAVCLAAAPVPTARAGDDMPHGEGAKGAGIYPTLADNPQVATTAYVASVVLQGRNGMPGFGDRMSDDQVAAVVNYVRTHFGNQYPDPLSAIDVAKMR